MPVASVTYRFSQRFPVPAREAFEWCTDYQPEDLSLMREKGRREIQRITADTMIFKETIIRNGKRIRKVKLIKLNPSAFSWYNIQISGPNKNSAFLYQIISESKNRSKLNFAGLLLVYGRAKFTSQRIKKIATYERRYDSNAWKLLAKAMVKDKIRRRS